MKIIKKNPNVGQYGAWGNLTGDRRVPTSERTRSLRDGLWANYEVYMLNAKC
jgi:hypothetical protein